MAGESNRVSRVGFVQASEERDFYLEPPVIPEGMTCAEYRRGRAREHPHNWLWRMAHHRKKAARLSPPSDSSPPSLAPARPSPEVAWPGLWSRTR